MEKNTMYLAIAVVVLLIVAGVAAVVLSSGNDNNGSSEGIKIVLLKKDANSPAYSPIDEAAIYNKSYPLARDLYLYTDGVPNGTVFAWLEWILSPSGGQAHTKETGYYPLPPTVLAQMTAQLDKPNHSNVTNGDISEKGSDTMYELTVHWASLFQNKTGAHVTISGGGSGTGITAFINGDVQVAQASRKMKQSEIDQAIAKGMQPVEWKVAMDGIAVIVNKNNPVSTLTMAQLSEIYKGNTTNWDEVGGNNQAIALYGRNSASGTYAYFKEVVLMNQAYSPGMSEYSGNAQIVVQVSKNGGGIGYVGIGYAKEANPSAHSASTSFSSDVNALISMAGPKE